ncbi:MAG TPA: MXAN_6640 family putative metalloprotease [Candidatus Krumholzibacteria bacterium]|nr:MXAN_6640 family putative metalloprotease [Candidatus Krumholzibacteria bacterium]
MTTKTTSILSLGAVALLAVVPVHAQTAASLDDLALIEQVDAALHGGGETPEQPVRCLFPHLMEMEARGLAVAALEPVLERATLLEYPTPEGHFVIQYWNDGRDALPDSTDADANGVPDYVEWVAEAMEESYQREVVELGFPFPTGGRYVVRLKSLFGGTYGLTRPFQTSFFAGTFIEINNDFESFYRSFPDLTNDDPDGLIRGAIRVTAAHEFKHAIQLAEDWNIDSPHTQWFEVDAVWMEEVVYDGVNDYYNYIRNSGSPFTSPSLSMLNTASYEDATWQMFLEQEYGVDFMLDLSERRATLRDEFFPFAYENVAADRQLVWSDVWRRHALYNYLTADRAAQSFGFTEAAHYPRAPVDSIPALPHTEEGKLLAPWANRFHEFDNSAGDASGELRVVFDAENHGDWGLSVVLQNETVTHVVPLSYDARPDTFAILGFDVVDFERVGLVVGNGRTAMTTSPADTYTFSVELDDSVRAEPSSFGSLKARY